MWREALRCGAASFLVTACASSQSRDTGPCEQPAYGACNEPGSPEMRPYDEARGCVDAPVAPQGVCVGSVTGIACASGSILNDCAFAPDGRMYFVVERGDEYVSGAGWRSTHYPDYGPARPSDAAATTAEAARCVAAQCAPACTGTPARRYSSCQDAGLGGTDAASPIPDGARD